MHVVTERRGISTGGIVAIVIGVVVLLMCAGCGIVFLFAAENASEEVSEKDGSKADTKTIIYEVTGNGTADITYIDDDGGSTRQQNDATLPWTLNVEADDDFAWVSVTATRNASDGGSITCRILDDDEELKTGTSAGPHAFVSCAGMA